MMSIGDQDRVVDGEARNSRDSGPTTRRKVLVEAQPTLRLRLLCLTGVIRHNSRGDCVGDHTHGASGLTNLAPPVPRRVRLFLTAELPGAVFAVVVPATSVMVDTAAHVAVVDGA